MNGYQQMNYYGQQTYYDPHFGAPPPLQPAAVAVPTNNISSLFSSSIATRPTGIAAPNTSVPAFAPHNQYQHQQPHSNLVCVPCERTFTQASQLAAHTQTHIKCSFCSLSAAKKVIQLHEEEVHGKVDAAEVPEELKARIGKLETREEIAKWIEERKKNYPTEANVAKKKEEATEQKKKRKEAGLDDERGVCAQFRRGRCSRGNSCRFRHEVPIDGLLLAFTSYLTLHPFIHRTQTHRPLTDRHQRHSVLFSLPLRLPRAVPSEFPFYNLSSSAM
jgi:hypothetical protein